ncbi:MAG: hypothetical protein P8Z81_11650 [Deinococcales bacterium]
MNAPSCMALGFARGVLRRLPGTVAVVVLAAVAGALAAAFAQPAEGAQASVELGLGGNLVAGAWNPLQVTVRDAGPCVLRLRIDEGTLMTGPRIVRYTAAVPGGSGVTVFDDDVYVPRFQTLSWTLSETDRVLASGSLGARDADARPLQVVVSAAPGVWRDAFAADARFVDVAASQLPARAAAYDGVATLLLDGTAAAPQTASIAAAAAGGAQVLLAGTLPASQAGLGRLAGAGADRLGAGEVRIVADDPAAVEAALRSWRKPDRSALVTALTSAPLVKAPRSAPQPLVLSLAAAYALIALLALRFAGTPGAAAAVALALIVSLAGWRLLRPPAAVVAGDRTVMLGGGELALALGVEERITLPAGTVSVRGAARPLTPALYSVDAAGTHVALERWQGVVLASRSWLRPASLRFEGGKLLNAGSTAFQNVYVVGLGSQPALQSGASLTPAPGEEGARPPEMARLAAVLPRGTALAEGPEAVWVALPPLASAAGGAR